MSKKLLIVNLFSMILLLTCSQLFAQSMENLRINGFMTAAYTRSDNEIAYYELIDDKPEFRDYSKYGLQFLYEVNEDTEVLMQLIGKGKDDYEPITEWALLKYHMTDELSLKIGKIQLPFFLFSETKEVTYAQPWLRAPFNVYSGEGQSEVNTISVIDGMDLTYVTDIFDDYNLLVQLVGGSKETVIDFTLAGRTSEVTCYYKNIYGLNLEFGSFSWTIKLTQIQGHLDVSSVANNVTIFETDDVLLNWTNAAFRYDEESLLILIEGTQYNYDAPGTDDIIRREGSYITLGYRVTEAIMPHVTYSQWRREGPQAVFGEDVISEEIASIIGLRIETGFNVAFKIDYQTVRVEETVHNFEEDPEEDVHIIAIGFDSVF